MKTLAFVLLLMLTCAKNPTVPDTSTKAAISAGNSIDSVNPPDKPWAITLNNVSCTVSKNGMNLTVITVASSRVAGQFKHGLAWQDIDLYKKVNGQWVFIEWINKFYKGYSGVCAQKNLLTQNAQYTWFNLPAGEYYVDSEVGGQVMDCVDFFNVQDGWHCPSYSITLP